MCVGRVGANVRKIPFVCDVAPMVARPEECTSLPLPDTYQLLRIRCGWVLAWVEGGQGGFPFDAPVTLTLCNTVLATPCVLVHTPLTPCFHGYGAT